MIHVVFLVRPGRHRNVGGQVHDGARELLARGAISHAAKLMRERFDFLGHLGDRAIHQLLADDLERSRHTRFPLSSLDDPAVRAIGARCLQFAEEAHISQAQIRGRMER